MKTYHIWSEGKEYKTKSCDSVNKAIYLFFSKKGIKPIEKMYVLIDDREGYVKGKYVKSNYLNRLIERNSKRCLKRKNTTI